MESAPVRLERPVDVAEPSRPRRWMGALAGLGIIACSSVMGMAAPAMAAVTQSVVQQDSTAVVNQMLARGGHTVTDAERKDVQQWLAKVPLPVLQAVNRDGTAIVVMQPGQTPRDVGVIHPMSEEQITANLPNLQKAADDAFARADQQYGTKIQDLQKKLAAARAEAAKHSHPVPAPVGGFGGFAAAPDPIDSDPAVQDAALSLAQAQIQASNQVWDDLFQKVGNQLEPLGAGTSQAGPFSMNVGSMLRNMPNSLNGIAELHGAKTAQQKQQFIAALKAVNGNRLQKAYAAAEKVLPHLPGMKEEDRPLIAGDVLAIPAWYYSDNGQIISSHDWGSLNDWKAKTTEGQYWYQDGVNTIVYQAGNLDRSDEGSSKVVHEMGHAYKRALQKNDAKWYQDFITRWHANYTQGHYITSYAATNDEEDFAEDFSAYFAGHRDKMPAADLQLMQEAVSRAK